MSMKVAKEQFVGVTYDELIAENAKLRERAVILRQGRWSDGPEDAELMEHAADTIEQLERKNAKLRELVMDWRALAVYGEDSLSDWIEIQADLESRMRELGVWV